MARALSATAGVSSACTGHSSSRPERHAPPLRKHTFLSIYLHFYLFIYIFKALSYFIIQSSAKLSVFLNVLPRACAERCQLAASFTCHARHVPARCVLPLLARANVGTPTSLPDPSPEHEKPLLDASHPAVLR